MNQDFKLIIKKPTGNMSTTFNKSKLLGFIKDNNSQFKKYLYVGWVRRLPFDPNNEKKPKKSMRFIACTSDERSELRKLHKKGEDYGVNIWDLTDYGEDKD